MRAVDLAIRSGLPDEPVAPRWAVDAVLGTRRNDMTRLTRAARAAHAAALASCLVRSGRAQEAVDLADRQAMEFLQRAVGATPAATLSACYATLSECYLANGRVHEASDCARIAREYADESGDDACVFRALSLLAASKAANGQFAESTAILRAADEIGEPRGWGADKWPTVLAQALLAHRRGDADDLVVALGRLHWEESSDVAERAVAGIARIWVHAIREEFRDMLVAAQRFTRGVDRRACPPILLAHACSAEALAHVHLGEPGAALRAIAGRTSPPGHAVCFELQRAGIHLQLQEPRKALQATEACVANTPDHNLRTLPSVLLRRAIALEMLGMSEAADAEFSRSSHLAAELGAVTPAIGVGMEVVERLYWRLMTNEPEFGKVIAARIPPDGSYPAPEPLGFAPTSLTDREKVLAGWLITELTFTEIAARLHVSINTVKTQTRSLYKKLGVASRAEAVRALEHAGHVHLAPAAEG